MKRQLLILIMIWGSLYSQAQHILDLGTGNIENLPQSTCPSRDIEKQPDGYIITYNFDKALIKPDDLFLGTTFWSIDGFGYNQNQGEPCTLLRNELIALPSGCSANIAIVSSSYKDYNYELTPARQELLNSSNEVYTKQNVAEIEPYEGLKPTNIVSITGIQSYRGQKICQTMIAPIQYDYKNKKVRAYTSISYKITFTPTYNIAKAGTTTVPVSYISNDDSFMNNNVIGGNVLETRSSSNGNLVQEFNKDYLIISTHAYSSAAERFAEWKRMLGYNVHVLLRDDWTPALIKSTVINTYNNHPNLYYLLIIGDHEDVPAESFDVLYTHTTDFYYGCVDDDYISDIQTGRLSVSSLSEADIVVNKIINYEQNPPSKASFYSNALHCSYFQDDNRDGRADKRFAETSEDVRDYVLKQGKSIKRIYYTESNVFPQYWNNDSFSFGDAIPSELKKPGFSWTGNATDITNEINKGVFYVLHRDHGDVSGWGHPEYRSNNINQLSNGNLLPVVFSINCFTGVFEDNCFAETFLRKNNGGCVAIYAATRSSYSGYNDALTTGMFDAIWPTPGLSITIPKTNSNYSSTPIPTYTLGSILQQGLIRMAETYGYDSRAIYTHGIFHCFGDPSMQIYTSQPTVFANVSINRNEASVSVSLGSNESAKITIYDPNKNEVQSCIGHSATINTSNPYEVIVCVSDHNRIPFIQVPSVSFIQNREVSGTLIETNDVIKVGNHVTTSTASGDVTTKNANITLKAKKIVLDSGTFISTGTNLRIVNP